MWSMKSRLEKFTFRLNLTWVFLYVAVHFVIFYCNPERDKLTNERDNTFRKKKSS